MPIKCNVINGVQQIISSHVIELRLPSSTGSKPSEGSAVNATAVWVFCVLFFWMGLPFWKHQCTEVYKRLAFFTWMNVIQHLIILGFYGHVHWLCSREIFHFLWFLGTEDMGNNRTTRYTKPNVFTAQSMTEQNMSIKATCSVCAFWHFCIKTNHNVQKNKLYINKQMHINPMKALLLLWFACLIGWHS